MWTIYKLWKTNEHTILKLWTLIKNIIESTHKFPYNILFTFLMDRGRAPNGIGHLMILHFQNLTTLLTKIPNHWPWRQLPFQRKLVFILHARHAELPTTPVCSHIEEEEKRMTGFGLVSVFSRFMCCTSTVLQHRTMVSTCRMHWLIFGRWHLLNLCVFSQWTDES